MRSGFHPYDLARHMYINRCVLIRVILSQRFRFVKKYLADASGKRSGERIFQSRISSCIDPVSNDPFLPLFCHLLPPVPFGFLQRFCRYFGSGPTLVNKVNPVKTGQDWPRPPKTAQDCPRHLGLPEQVCTLSCDLFPSRFSFLACQVKTRGASAYIGANHIDPGIGR